MDIFAQLEEEPWTSDRRGSARRRLRLRIENSALSSAGSEVIIHDLSEGGLLIETSANLAVGEHVELNIPEAGVAEATVVWNDGRHYGCKFPEPIPTAALSAALLQSPGHSADERSSGGLAVITMALRELRALRTRADSISEQLERAIGELSNNSNSKS